MKCWVQSIQMRRWRAFIHPAILAPDGMSGEVRQWQDLAFLLRPCPFFRVRQSRRLLAAAYHFDIASFGRYFFFSTLLFFHSVLHFNFYIFRTHAALGAILAFQIFSVHFFFLHGSHAFRNRKSVYASRCPFYFPTFSQKGRIAKTTHEGKTRKCTGCDTSIQPGVH